MKICIKEIIRPVFGMVGLEMIANAAIKKESKFLCNDDFGFVDAN